MKCFALETCLMFYTLVTLIEVLWAQCDAYYFNHLRLHLGAKLCAVIVGFLSLRFSFHTPFRRMKGFNETACAESTIMDTSRMPLFSFRARGTEWSIFCLFHLKKHVYRPHTLLAGLLDVHKYHYFFPMWGSNQIPLKKYSKCLALKKRRVGPVKTWN